MKKLGTLLLATFLGLGGCASVSTSDGIPKPKPERVCKFAEKSIRTDLALDPNCVYEDSGLRIEAPDVVLDCQGATIEAANKRAISVVGERVRNVIIRNCRIDRGSIFVGMESGDAAKAKRWSRDELYELTPHDVTIERVEVKDAPSVGIYLDDYVSRVTIRDSVVYRSGSAGVYLEHSSRDNVIRNTRLDANGYGKFPELRVGESRREGVAVDSSAGNLIEGNTFKFNAGGGVFLYKNCHEHSTTDPQQVRRWQHSERNVIRNNVFIEEHVGVWLASRQSRDLGTWDCGDAPYFERSLYLDYAHDNLVEGNEFRDTEVAVRVEDDNNTLRKNKYVKVSKQLEVGAKMREKILGKPVIGTVVED